MPRKCSFEQSEVMMMLFQTACFHRVSADEGHCLVKALC